MYSTGLNGALPRDQFSNIKKSLGGPRQAAKANLLSTASSEQAKGESDHVCQGVEDLSLGFVDPEKKPLVAVIGCGYVGTHLIQAFSRHYEVLGFDVSAPRLELLREQFRSEGTQAALTTSPEQLTRATHLLVSVPTLVLKDRSIDTSYIRDALAQVARYARSGATVVIESSVAVGMTRQLLGPLAKRRGFYAGMSPERVDPGRTEPPVEKIPKILSGLDDVAPGSRAAISALYGRVFARLVPVSRPEVAEMMKLYENCQRMMNIAFANEMADACGPHGIDPYEVCRAAASKPFGYMPFEPGVGLGGHCIPVNPWYLLSNSDFPLLRAATETMDRRPAKIAEQTLESLFDASNTSNVSASPNKQQQQQQVRNAAKVSSKPSSRPSSWDSACAGGVAAEDKVLQAASILNSLTDDNVRRLSGSTATAAQLQQQHEEEEDQEEDEDDEGRSPSRSPSLGESDTTDVSGLTIAVQPRVLVVGVGFKPGQSNLTNSPGLKVAQTLHASGKVDVLFADPFVEQAAVPAIPRFDDQTRWNKQELETFDKIIVSFQQQGMDLAVLDQLESVAVERWYRTD